MQSRDHMQHQPLDCTCIKSERCRKVLRHSMTKRPPSRHVRRDVDGGPCTKFVSYLVWSGKSVATLQTTLQLPQLKVAMCVYPCSSIAISTNAMMQVSSTTCGRSCHQRDTLQGSSCEAAIHHHLHTFRFPHTAATMVDSIPAEVCERRGGQVRGCASRRC